ncbi:MAG TPA: hypothetical protein VLW86_09350, partial [Syntrophorhabdales bacterium]|nr:hypothetical protein [Syntrophorhabdales bacterium]
MDTFIGMLLHTPWWVYLAFAYVIYAGLKAMRPRRVSFVRLLVPPAIFTVVSAFNVIGRMGDHVLYITPWSLA